MTAATTTARLVGAGRATASQAARLGLCLLLAAGCRRDEEFSGTFDTPGAVATLDPSTGGPFDEPVGYAADRHGGRIRVLALARRALYLEAAPWASFFRGRPLATGRARLLGHVAAYAPGPDAVSVLAVDTRHRVLLSVPHVRGLDGGRPITPAPVVGPVTFSDRDGSGDRATLTWVDAQQGLAATERWTLTCVGDGAWEVVGSRSGAQPTLALTGVPFLADGQTISLLVEGTATPGDVLTVDVDTGIVEQPLDGVPVAMTLSRDQTRVALVVADDDGVHRLRWHDPATLAPLGEVPLPPDARVHRMAWSADGASLFVADAHRPAAWEITPGETDVVVEHTLPWPLLDLAPLTTDDGRRLLYVAPLQQTKVWLLDLDASALVDVNPSTPDVDGMELLSPIRGLESIHEPYTWPRPDIDGNQRAGRSVAITLHSGRVVWMEEATGCLVSDRLGPRSVRLSVTNSFGDYDPQFALVENETAWLQRTQDPFRHVYVNPCAGVAPSESWELRYDENVQGWLARGEISGAQPTPAREDARWVSDNGAVHLLMRAGRTPSQDGWRILFQVADGVLAANGDSNEDVDDIREVSNFDLPGEPSVFWSTVADERRPFVVLSAEAGDIVVRVDATTGNIDAFWD